MFPAGTRQTQHIGGDHLGFLRDAATRLAVHVDRAGEDQLYIQAPVREYQTERFDQ
jgi:hypothetical protein